MLLVERKATIPSEYVVQKINSFVNNFLNEIFQRFGGKAFKDLYKLNDNIVKKYENWLDKRDGYEYMGDIWVRDLETNKNSKIKVFIFSSKLMEKNRLGNSNAAYIYPKTIILSADYLKEHRVEIISTIEHEIIHSIHKFKKTSSRYKPEELGSQQDSNLEMSFNYYTEAQEFDTILGEMFVFIIKIFKSSDDNRKKEILYVLKDLLKKNKDYFKEIHKTDRNKIQNYLLYRRKYIELIYMITHPPVLDYPKYAISDDVLQNLSNEKRVEIVSKRREIKYKNEKYQKVANNRYLQFKQKLFNTYQKLFDEYRKMTKKV